ncbi:C4-dicarboxylate ABC transporter permease [Salegentibacter salinarum]|uniref:C4-dicarboxylate ABC transporter permease n=1 Tax=Salegentibacter salinarum TaxID=447422 RepID=A0A2N0TY81_9FLAO|nr:TRAP transporter small permease [Salegentibacter salinarum]PKD19710.1 C4-dicarboxylate ABC transporter permease [Salegentibacter salinarum]SKB89831.1 TRAP-type C4-dicarboxylate transport system, small permease component [Salegentibacter salinarum]
MSRKLNWFLEWLVVCLVTVMLFSVLWGVCSRYLLADQSSWTDELARFMLIWVSLFGAVYISGRNTHITIDLLPKSFSVKTKLKLDLLVQFIIMLFTASIFVIGGGRYVYVSFKLEQTSAALGLPMGFVYLVLPISGLMIIYFKWMQMQRTLQELKANR